MDLEGEHGSGQFTAGMGMDVSEEAEFIPVDRLYEDEV
jgi:hypothetical protein